MTPGPKIRTDIVDVYVFRRRDGGVEFLQLLRRENPLGGTWHPVMGHVEPGERATQTARRELMEEIGLDVAGPACLGLWQLNQVHPFLIAATDEIFLSPRFAAEVTAKFELWLCEEHSEQRWVEASEVGARFMWPGQRGAIAEILHEIIRPDSISRDYLRVQA